VFETPQAAHAALAATPKAWDMVITDLRVLGPNGLKLAKSVRDLHPGLCHGLISDFPASVMAREAAAAALAPILPKPTRLEEFDTLVERIAGQCRSTPAKIATSPSSRGFRLADGWYASSRSL
jgi:DNA-binding NtrC family response regulator